MGAELRSPTPAREAAWLSYWESLPPGHLLFAPESEEYAQRFLKDFAPPRSAIILDYGCGYACATRLIAPHVGRICYYDAVAGMQAAAGRRLAGVANASAWDESSVERFDFILLNSVIQYLTLDQLADRMRLLAGRLVQSGRIVISDVSLAGHHSASDVISLLSFSLRRGYFTSALRWTLAERSRYQVASGAQPLLHPSRAELQTVADQAGLCLAFHRRNLTHFGSRKTIVLSRREPA